MKRILWLTVVGVALIFVVVAVVRNRNRPPATHPPTTPAPSAFTNAPAVPPVAVTSVPIPPAEKLPAGWQDFRTLTEQERLDRVTAAMENHTLPADVLAFFEKDIFNRQHWDVTRNNMANALVWQESPNPRLHELFAKMLADESESPVWRDYCLQFLSDCLLS